MPDGAFKASLNPTDVRTKIFVIDKPANEVKPLPSPEGKRVTVATPRAERRGAIPGDGGCRSGGVPRL